MKDDFLGCRNGCIRPILVLTLFFFQVQAQTFSRRLENPDEKISRLKHKCSGIPTIRVGSLPNQKIYFHQRLLGLRQCDAYRVQYVGALGQDQSASCIAYGTQDFSRILEALPGPSRKDLHSVGWHSGNYLLVMNLGSVENIRAETMETMLENCARKFVDESELAGAPMNLAHLLSIVGGTILVIIGCCAIACFLKYRRLQRPQISRSFNRDPYGDDIGWHDDQW